MYFKLFCSMLFAFLSRFADTKTIGDVFPEVKGDLTKITWANAVNNQSFLKETLESDVMMVEGHVSYGHVQLSDPLLPIMALPPKQISDLSLADFLTTMESFNANSTNRQKGVKLQFTSTNAWLKSLDILEKFYVNINYVFWLNAEIILGPTSLGGVPVNHNTFLSKVKRFNKSLTVVSPGWTSTVNRYAVFKEFRIKNMINVIQFHNITQYLSFSVDAGVLSRKSQMFMVLKEEIPNCTMILWSRPIMNIYNIDGMNIQVEKLRQFILEFGRDKIYLDVPQELRNRLNLENN